MCCLLPIEANNLYMTTNVISSFFGPMMCIVRMLRLDQKLSDDFLIRVKLSTEGSTSNSVHAETYGIRVTSLVGRLAAAVNSSRWFQVHVISGRGTKKRDEAGE